MPYLLSEAIFFKEGISRDWWDGALDKGTWCQALWSEFDQQNHKTEGKKQIYQVLL